MDYPNGSSYLKSLKILLLLDNFLDSFRMGLALNDEPRS